MKHWVFAWELIRYKTRKQWLILKYDLDKSFQEILYRIDNWINEVSGWVVESIDAKYVNISNYSALSWSPCIELPKQLRKQWLKLKAMIINALFGVISNT